LKTNLQLSGFRFSKEQQKLKVIKKTIF
jgi:hypothetical protein